MGLPVLKDSYPGDEYIVGLAREQTKCFGLKFEVNHETCRSCPLAGSCQSQFYDNLTGAAVEVANRMPNQEPEEDVDALIQEAVETPKAKVTKFSAFADSICCVCGKKVSQGEEAWHHFRDGFFHEGCLDDYHKGVRHK